VDIAGLDNAAPDQTDRNGLNIRQPKKQPNMMNDKRIKSHLSRFDSGAYSRPQFLRAVSHSVGAHTESLQPRDDNSSSKDEDEDRRVGAGMTNAGMHNDPLGCITPECITLRARMPNGRNA